MIALLLSIVCVCTGEAAGFLLLFVGGLNKATPHWVGGNLMNWQKWT